jgi:hypothetical protein
MYILINVFENQPYSVFASAIFGMNFVILRRCAYFLVNYSIKYCPNSYLPLHEIYK